MVNDSTHMKCPGVKSTDSEKVVAERQYKKVSFNKFGVSVLQDGSSCKARRKDKVNVPKTKISSD